MSSIVISMFRNKITSSLLHAFSIRHEFNLKSELCEQTFEALVQRLPFVSLPSQSVQIGQVYLVMVRMKSMLREDGFVRRVHGTERAESDIGMLLSGLDDLVQDGDIYCALSTTAPLFTT